MNDPHKEHVARCHSEIREAIMKHWDPIGVASVPECADEYDDYVPEIYQMLAKGRSPKELFIIFGGLKRVTWGWQELRRPRAVWKHLLRDCAKFQFHLVRLRARPVRALKLVEVTVGRLSLRPDGVFILTRTLSSISRHQDMDSRPLRHIHRL